MNNIKEIGFNTLITFFILSFVLTARAALPGDSKISLEVLHGISVEPDTLSIDVLSSGCTSNDDFKFDLRKRKTGIELAVFRVRPDFCRAFSHNVTLTFKRSAIGLQDIDSFRLRNAFRGFPRFSL